MNIPLPDDLLSVDLLAAFLDGKLNASEQARVEQWLSEHPEAAVELNDPDARTLFDETFWKEVAPPQIAPERWDTIVAEVRRVVAQQHFASRSRKGRVGAAGALALVAASVLLFFIFQSNVPKPTEVPAHPAALAAQTDDEVFLIAQNDDVEIFRMPGDAQTALVVGEHPLDSAPLSLATKEDLEVFSFGGISPGDVDNEEPGAPMIWPPQKK